MGLLTDVDGMNQILLVAMAIWANLVDRDENYCPLEGLLVGRFSQWFLCLRPTEKKSCWSWKWRRTCFFFLVARGCANEGINVFGFVGDA